jgi:hypothetical protein
MIKQVAASAAGMVRLRRVLATATEPLTAVQLGELAHLSPEALRSTKYLPSMLLTGEIYIATWIAAKMGRMSAGYLLGPGRSVPHPGFCKLAAASQWKKDSGYAEAIRSKKLLDKFATTPPLVFLAGMRT